MSNTTNIKGHLTSGPIVKPLVFLAIPLLLESLISHLYTTIDILFIGNFGTTLDQSAIGSSGMICTMLVGFFTGFAIGSGVLVSHAFGAKDKILLTKTIHTSISIGALFGLLIAAFGFFISPFALEWMQTPIEILPSAISYIRIYFLSTPLLLMFTVASSIVRSCGNTKVPMICSLSGGVANIIADFIFLAAFNLGVEGVAIATLFSQSASSISLLIYMLVTKREYKLVLRKLAIDFHLAFSIFKIGMPAGIQAMSITFSNVICQSFINSLGINAIGGFTIFYRVETFVYQPIVAFGQAMTIFSGQNCGANDFRRVKKGTYICLALSMGVTIILSMTLLIFSYKICYLFNQDMLVLDETFKILSILCPLYFIYCIIEVFSGTLRGAGQSLFTMIFALINIAGLRLIYLFIMMNIFPTIYTVSLVYPITWICTSICLTLFFFFGKWEDRFKKAHKNLHNSHHHTHGETHSDHDENLLIDEHNKLHKEIDD